MLLCDWRTTELAPFTGDARTSDGPIVSVTLFFCWKFCRLRIGDLAATCEEMYLLLDINLCARWVESWDKCVSSGNSLILRLSDSCSLRRFCRGDIPNTPYWEPLPSFCLEMWRLRKVPLDLGRVTCAALCVVLGFVSTFCCTIQQQVRKRVSFRRIFFAQSLATRLRSNLNCLRLLNNHTALSNFVEPDKLIRFSLKCYSVVINVRLYPSECSQGHSLNVSRRPAF